MTDIQFRRPQLEDQELFCQYFRKYPSRSCERTFANVLLWAKHYQVTFAMVKEAIVFRSESGQTSFAFPVGEDGAVRDAIDWLTEYCRKSDIPFIMYNVTPEQFEELEQWYPERFEITYDRDSADYVYESEKLSTLSGKKLHAKRNHINKFKATHENWSYEPITQENIEECFQMALLWRNQNGCEEDEEKNAEMCVTLNSLRLYEELGLRGGVLRNDGNIIAFTMGEPVNEDTFVVHIEKAFAEIQGAYPMINQQFVSHECMEYAYVNREEDTGAEGLRKAKLSYYPVFLVEKGLVKERTL